MKIDKAKISDAQQIHELVNKYAQIGLMLPRALGEIYQNLRDWFVIRDSDNKVIACVALNINWADMAEVRSLAVDEKYQSRGLASKLVKACLEEAKSLDIPTVFCLTYKPQFFEKQGFHIVDKTMLPRKIWSECYHCPKFPDCDEVAMTIRILPEKNQAKKQLSRTVSSQQIYDGRAVKLRIDTVITSSGRKTTREIVEHADCIVAVPVDENNNVIMVRQYREAIGKKLIELPAGGIDEGEQPLDALRRELQEEIGYLPQKIEKIGGFYPTPGYVTEYLHIYFATQLVPQKLEAEDTEEIEVIRIPLSRASDLIDSGEICDAKSIIGINRVIALGLKGS